MDQTAAGNISADMDDKNIDAMYKELQILKGSIKKLIIDIREEMSNAENPFLNLQRLQAPAPPKEMRNMEVPADIPIPDIEAPDGLEAFENIPEPEPPARGPRVKKKPAPQAPKAPASPAPDEVEDVAPEIEPYDIEVPKMLLRQMKEAMSEREAPKQREPGMQTPRRDEGRMDPDTIIKLMQWTRTALVKNGTVRFHNLLDAYVTMGYLSVETRGVIEKMSLLIAPDIEQAPKDIDIKECVGDMYTLFMILNPRDKNLDSKMLSVMLGYEDRMLNIL